MVSKEHAASSAEAMTPRLLTHDALATLPGVDGYVRYLIAATLIVSHLNGRRVVPCRQAQLRRAQPIRRLRWPSD